MKDTRDPIDVYHAILDKKTAFHCSILEAADRVERKRTENRAVRLPPGLPAIARVISRPEENGAQEGVQ